MEPSNDPSMIAFGFSLTNETEAIVVVLGPASGRENEATR
jgi:hypothetical protein